MFEVLMMSAGAPEGPPGPPGVKFLGEVPTAGFIDGEELASAIGLEAGIAQHTDPPWLHFVLDGKTLYVAKKPYRHSVSRNHISATDAFVGRKTIEINSKTYKIRVLKTVASGNRYSGFDNLYDPEGAYGSEWNRLMYSIHSGSHTNTSNPTPVSREGIRFGTLAQYTDADLVVHNSAGNGSRSWCQETRSNNTGIYFCRGNLGVSHLRSITVSDAGPTMGWRPVLELIE